MTPMFASKVSVLHPEFKMHVFLGSKKSDCHGRFRVGGVLLCFLTSLFVQTSFRAISFLCCLLVQAGCSEL